MNQTMNLELEGRSYVVDLYENETVDAFMENLPQTFTMSEMNGNEKYIFMDQSLPNDPESVGQIEAGDVMLYGEDCLVVFFASFSTSYTYTRIGHIQDAESFVEALPSGQVEMQFSLEEA